MKIYILVLNKDTSFLEYKYLLRYISYERTEKIERYLNDGDKVLSLFSELLLRKVILAKYQIGNDAIQFEYNEYGKPKLKGYSNFEFSISHTNSAIILAVDNTPIGIDIEKIRIANLRIAKRFFTQNEYNYIINSSDVNKSFFEIWTKKEAYVKMRGMGISSSFRSFDVMNFKLSMLNKTNYYVDYVISISSENISNINFDLEAVAIDDLLYY